ncbi:ACT domain-containing protein [Pilobolus umbonatus]|nr:ACT domain-containing protein [Pilobolus umbonatus]
MSVIQLIYYPDSFSVHQYNRHHRLDNSVFDAPWFTVSKTTSELSLIVPTAYPLSDIPIKTEGDWRMFQVDAQMDFGLVGILTRIITPLKDHGIPVFVVSTYDTDYVMVKEKKMAETIRVLSMETGVMVTPGNPIILKEINI